MLTVAIVVPDCALTALLCYSASYTYLFIITPKQHILWYYRRI